MSTIAVIKENGEQKKRKEEIGRKGLLKLFGFKNSLDFRQCLTLLTLLLGLQTHVG